jgi:hypothetical protein
VEQLSTQIGKSRDTMGDIIIDANLIRNIAQGNREAAEAMVRLLKKGRRIYIAHAAYNEVVHGTALAEQYGKLLKELKISVNPASAVSAAKGETGAITARGNVYADNLQQVAKPSRGIPGPMTEYGGRRDPTTGLKTRPGDAFVAAEAKALDAELWTLDQQFARQARQRGVKIAAESALDSVDGPEDIAMARTLLREALSTPPTPPVGAIRAAVAAAKVSFKAGVASAFSPHSIASALPDALLVIANKFAVRDAIRNIQTKFIKEGFAKGVAAGVMRWNEAEVASNLMNRVTNMRVEDLGDAGGTLKLPYILKLAEAYENYAVHVGFKYTFSQTVGWNNDLRTKGLEAMIKHGYKFGQNTSEFFEFKFIDRLAWVNRRTTDAIVGPAIRFK